jgi:hypothetical protein
MRIWLGRRHLFGARREACVDPDLHGVGAYASPPVPTTITRADHLHEHFADPVRVERGRYRPPERSGYSAEMKPEPVAAHSHPHGSVWAREVRA